MILYKLRLTSRNLAGNKVISLFSITGLALGLMAVLLVFQYINFEKSFKAATGTLSMQ
ncbi:MAG TPA: hypothetical protein VK155_05175 [Bacteroidales bacterium]|jgi:hypothetical protein|nr:hypothetical protein [Bacteroidales bacterium]